MHLIKDFNRFWQRKWKKDIKKRLPYVLYGGLKSSLLFAAFRRMSGAVATNAQTIYS